MHELGHSLFALEGEYFDLEATDVGYEECEGLAPNIAANPAVAESWWGDLVGEIDPFFYEYRDTLQGYDLWDEEQFDFEAALTVGFYPTDCNVRPTAHSIMDRHRPEEGAIPVFGTVNRLRAEQILGLWNRV